MRNLSDVIWHNASYYSINRARWKVKTVAAVKKKRPVGRLEETF